MIVGREKEIRKLNELYDSGNAELVASDYIFIVFLILAAAFAVYMVRQKFRGEIAILWKNKWS